MVKIIRKSRGSVSKIECFCWPKISVLRHYYIITSLLYYYVIIILLRHYYIQNVKDGSQSQKWNARKRKKV